MAKRIGSLAGLHQAALKRQSVIIPKRGKYAKPIPAAWAMNWQGTLLRRAIYDQGMYLYEGKNHG